MSDDIWIKRIKELENYISDNQDKIEELEKKSEWNGQQIVKAFNSLIEKHSMIAELKEVLRELLGNIQVFGSDSGYFGLEAQANSLLAKLDGSGGEKEVRVRHSEFDERNVPSDDLSTHSKPPEPIDWKKHFPATEQFIEDCKKPREDDLYFCPICGNELNMTEHLSFMACKTVVKREDLQFLYEYANDDGIYDVQLQQEFWKELKRIKEEYSL